MAAGLSAITGITKDLVFSTRRADRAAKSDNIAVAFGNADVATGQVKNALGGVERIVEESKSTFSTGFKGAKEALKAASKQNKVLEGASKVVGFTADHINPVITAVGGLKVWTAKDKNDALIDESLALGTMFTFEGIAKNVLEMEKKVKDPVTGAKKLIKRKAFYKSNPFLKAQSEKMEQAINDYCATSKLFNSVSLKHVPAIIKGLLFVVASITGYEVGRQIAKKVKMAIKPKSARIVNENHGKTAQKLVLKPNYTKTKQVAKAA